MAIISYFSFDALIFNGKHLNEKGKIVGYAAIIEKLNLPIPIPNKVVVISTGNKKYTDINWDVFPNSYLPSDDIANLSEINALYNHLVFALKYEGVNLTVFKKIGLHYSLDLLNELINIESTGQYSRRIWFLIEFLTDKTLKNNTSDIGKQGYVELIDSKLQYTILGTKSSRQRIINNLPGTADFCPMVFKTEKLETYIKSALQDKQTNYLTTIRKDILQRASAFLLLKDSKASFNIEGESPKSKRAARWGQVIGQAGVRDLSHEELNRLQQIVIENPRFLKLGYREKGGFVGEHDRVSGEPIPDHISAKYQDLEILMNGLIKTNELLLKNEIDSIIVAAIIAFGFVFIHPFVDGNGRIHRYLIHHVLAKKGFSQQGIIFPISASILDKIVDYKKVLESYSIPLLDYIDWNETKDHNVEVTNETIDYYRYFDATKQAEFLYDCVNDTIERIIPAEIDYLTKYDAFKSKIEDNLEMPDSDIAMLARFLEQNNGKLSKRAKENEFSALTAIEIEMIEDVFLSIF
jgi:Fic/DOC family